jgi:hypothetical protein
MNMLTVHDIKKAILQLKPEDLARVRKWFEEFDSREWDTQFEADAKSDKLDKLANQAIEEFRAGKTKEL